MTLNEYQQKAMATCMPSCENFSYMFINLVGETGELASKIAKAIRKEQIYIGSNSEKEDNHLMLMPGFAMDKDKLDAFSDAVKGELGDVLWQLSGLCTVMGFTLEDIAQSNYDKLASRKKRGVIDGNGDNR